MRFSASCGASARAPGRAEEPHVGLPAAGARKDARRPRGDSAGAAGGAELLSGGAVRSRCRAGEKGEGRGAGRAEHPRAARGCARLGSTFEGAWTPR